MIGLSGDYKSAGLAVSIIIFVKLMLPFTKFISFNSFAYFADTLPDDDYDDYVWGGLFGSGAPVGWIFFYYSYCLYYEDDELFYYCAGT